MTMVRITVDRVRCDSVRNDQLGTRDALRERVGRTVVVPFFLPLYLILDPASPFITL